MTTELVREQQTEDKDLQLVTGAIELFQQVPDEADTVSLHCVKGLAKSNTPIIPYWFMTAIFSAMEQRTANHSLNTLQNSHGKQIPLLPATLQLPETMAALIIKC